MIGPYVLLYAALIGYFAFAATYHAVLWSAARRDALLAVFSIDCVVRAALCYALIAVITAEDPARAYDAVSLRIALVLLTVIGTIWTVRLVSGVRADWFVWPMTAVFFILFVVQVGIIRLNAPIISISRTALPWGETVSIPLAGTPGWWVGPMYLLGYSTQLFAVYCGAQMWRRDPISGALVVMAACATILIATLEALRTFKVFTAPILGAFPNVLWVFIFALLIARSHRRTKDELAASEQRFRGIFEQTFQFIGLLRTDGLLLEANRTALDFAGVDEGEVINKPFWETPWWAHSAELRQRLREAIRTAAEGTTVRFEVTHPRPNGGLAYVDFSLKPVRDDEGRVILLIPEGRDVTDHKEAEEKRRMLEAQLAQAQKMEAIGQLAGGVAHDFNNLLTVINGYGEMLQESIPDDDSRRAIVADILEAGNRAAAVTRQLLTFSRRQVSEPRVIDLNVVVTEAERMLRRLIGEQIRLETAILRQAARVNVDRGQLEQVIINLAVNARDAMPLGGTLTIGTDLVELDAAAAAEYSNARSGRYVVLAVTDTGCGITPQVLARIFEPFFTTKGPGKGTGLGLATVRNIADECGGFISVTSTPGSGSTFRLFIPSLPVAAASGDAPKPEKSPGGSETILLVEDDDAVRALTARMLRQCGYQVLDVEGGAEAIEAVENRSDAVDLLVTDVVMPEMGGRELAERLQATRPGLSVLYLSGYTDDQVFRHGVSQAGTAFLQKPFTIEGLSGKVRELLDAATLKAT